MRSSHAGVAVAERLGEVGQQVVDGGRERAEAGGARAHVAHAAHGLARRLHLGEHALGVRRQRRPASVSTTPRPTRRNSGTPSSPSSRRICSDSDGWARCSTLAAPLNDCCAAASRK